MRIEGSKQEMLLYSGSVQTDSAENQGFKSTLTGKMDESRSVEFGAAFRVDISDEAYQKQAEAAKKAKISANAQMSQQKKMIQMRGESLTRETYQKDRQLRDQQNMLLRAKYLLEGYLRTSQVDTQI